jgi:glycosidase
MMKKSILSLVALVFLLASCNTQSPNNSTTEAKATDAVKVEPRMPPDWSKNANIYEVNVRQYTPEGTFSAFAKELPRLKEMGVDILWFMPIHPIGLKNRKGTLGSYYSVQDYVAVNPEYGSFEDFKKVVDEAHALGMYVILDWVANHTSWDHAWMESHPDYYEKNEKGEIVSPFDWTDVAALNFNNENLRVEMINALKFWITEANVDGYRCDVASEVPTDFWERARMELDQVKPVFMLAESEDPALLNSAFDMNYGWEFHHIMNKVAKKEKTPKDVLEYLDREKAKTPQRGYMMYFIDNHDENSWNGTIAERLGDADEAMAVLTFTLGGMPMIYSGQEAANAKRLLFFEKDPINWSGYPKKDFYKTLIDLKHRMPALWNGKNGGEMTVLPTNQDDKVLCFKKINGESDVMVLVNLSDQIYQANFTQHDLVNYKPLISKAFQPTMEVNSFTMYPWGYIILEKVSMNQ